MGGESRSAQKIASPRGRIETLSAFLPYRHRLANPARNQIPVVGRMS